jgi:H+-transporting ATPase
MTIVQAVGAIQLSHRGALVTRLDSVEDAASIDSLCLDKTGTVTENRLRVTEVVSSPAVGENACAAGGELALGVPALQGLLREAKRRSDVPGRKW